LFQYIARSRLNISELLEEHAFYDKHIDVKSKWISKNLDFFQDLLHIRGGASSDLLRSCKSAKHLDEMGSSLPNELKKEIIFTMTSKEEKPKTA
jgi:hypothetical protein